MRHQSLRVLFLSCFLGLTAGSGLLPLSSIQISVQAAELNGQGSQDGVIKACTGQSINLGVPQLTEADLKVLTGCSSGVISQLLEALKSKDWKVKVIAAHTLGLFGKQAQSVIPELSSLMQDENVDVRFAMAQTLGKIGSKEVVSALAKALQDKDENVRFAAAESLVKVGTDAKEALPALANTLRDGNWFVRSRAANAFVHLAPQLSSLQPKLINAALVNQLQESPWGGGQKYVEYHLKRQQKIPAVVAFDALAEIGSEAAPSLIESLKSNDILARVPNPSLALINIGSKTGSDQVIPLLIQALQNPDWTVRKNAVLVLGGIGSKVAIPDLVNISPSRWGESPNIALGEIGFRVILGKRRVSFKQKQVKKFIPVLVAALRNEDWQIRVVAAAALGLIPSEVSTIPFIGEALRDQDWRVRSTAATALGKIYVYSDKNILNKIYLNQKIAFLKFALQDKDWRVRRNAVYAIEISDETIPLLVRLLKDNNENVALSAAIKLGGKSDLDIPILITALQHNKNALVRLESFDSLDQYQDRSNSASVILAMTQALHDENPIIRDRAALYLGVKLKFPDKYPTASTVVIPALIQTLQDENEKVRTSAVLALEGTGETALIDLIKASKDKNERVRILVIEALGNIGSQAAIPTITAALQDESDRVRSTAVKALGKFKSVTQEVINNLQSKDWQVRRNAIEKLGLIGVNLSSSASSPSLQTLIKLLQDQNPNVRTSAAATLARSNSPRGRDLNPDTVNILQKAVPNLIDSLQKGDPLSRLDAIYVLGAIGSGARVAIPDLQIVLKDQNWLVRYGSALTLLKIDSQNELAVNVLADIFSDTNYAQMIEIDSCCTDHYELQALRKIGSDQAITALINSLQISDEKLRYTYYLGANSGDLPPTARELIEVGSKAIPALIKSLDNENIRFLSAEILGQIEPNAILPLLEVLKQKHSSELPIKEILKDKDVDIRRSVVYALGQIGKRNSASKATVIDTLTTVMNDKNEHPDVRWMAAASLENMGETAEKFFAEHNLPKPENEMCIESRFIDRFSVSDFDLYAARCLYAAGGRGAGLSEIFNQIRALLSGTSR